jgi:hypothetical protein
MATGKVLSNFEAYRGDVVVREEPEATQPRPSIVTRKDSKAPSPDKLIVDPTARPDWVAASTVSMKVGDDVYCTGGSGSVVRVLGKTGNGSRLLEVKLDSGVRDSFFVPASNVLTPPK